MGIGEDSDEHEIEGTDRRETEGGEHCSQVNVQSIRFNRSAKVITLYARRSQR